jgi:hypothetical protein
VIFVVSRRRWYERVKRCQSTDEHPVAVNDRNSRTGDVVGLELGVHHAVEELLEGILIGERLIGLSLLTGFDRTRAAGYISESERRGTRRREAANHVARAGVH